MENSFINSILNNNNEYYYSIVGSHNKEVDNINALNKSSIAEEDFISEQSNINEFNDFLWIEIQQAILTEEWKKDHGITNDDLITVYQAPKDDGGDKKDPPDGGKKGKKLRSHHKFSYNDYLKIYEKRHGKKMSKRRKHLLAGGCLGITSAELGYVVKPYDVPPTTYTFSSFPQALAYSKMIQRMINSVSGLSTRTRAIIYSIRFYTDSPELFNPDNNGRVDMSSWNPKTKRPDIDAFNFDFGFYDAERNKWWDANHGEPNMSIYKRNLVEFSRRLSDFNMQVYTVALTIEQQ